MDRHKSRVKDKKRDDTEDDVKNKKSSSEKTDYKKIGNTIDN